MTNTIELATEVWGYSDWKGAPLERLERFAALVRAEREWVDLTDDEKVMLSDRLNLDRRIVVIDAVIAAFKEKNK